MSNLYLRQWSLVVSSATETLDLSGLRITFRIKQADLATPNSASFRIYNLKQSTVAKIQREFTGIVFQVGYEGGPIAVLFSGTIVQVRTGREDQVNTYVELISADGDIAANFATVNTTLKAGATFEDRTNLFVAQMKASGVTPGYIAPGTPAAAPRGRVFYGMVRDHIRSEALAQGMTYSIQNGKVTMIPLNGFGPAAPVTLNPQTGLIEYPEQTPGGIHVRCLANPLLAVGSRLQLDASLIQQATVNPTFTGSAANNFPTISKDGIYRIYVLEHEGDTRGNDWYSDIICLATDPTAQVGLAATEVYTKGVLAGVNQ